MIEQLTRYFVPLKDDMSKFEELCDRKRLKKRDITIIFEHLDINYKTMSEVLKAREVQKPLATTNASEPKRKKARFQHSLESLMWVSIITSAVSMVTSVILLLVLAFG